MENKIKAGMILIFQDNDWTLVPTREDKRVYNILPKGPLSPLVMVPLDSRNGSN